MTRFLIAVVASLALASLGGCGGKIGKAPIGKYPVAKPPIVTKG